MSKILVSDFYYGSILSLLLNKHATPALVEGDDNRKIFEVTSDTNACLLYLKYRKKENERKNNEIRSWNFVFTDKEINEIESYIADNKKLIITLLCGTDDLKSSEIIVINLDKYNEIISKKGNFSSLTITRKKSEKYFRVRVGGSREEAVQVRTNGFDEIF